MTYFLTDELLHPIILYNMITNLLYPAFKGNRHLSWGMENVISSHSDEWCRNFYYGIDDTNVFITGTFFIGRD